MTERGLLSRRSVGARGFPWRTVLLLILSVVSLRLVYMAGQEAATRELPEQYGGNITDPAGAARSEIERLQNELEVERKRREMDKQALELVRSEIAAGSQERAALEEQLRFYRALMAPGTVKQGVSIRPPQLVAGETPGEIAFRILVQQKASKHQMVKGSLTVQVKGLLAGQEVIYPLSELTDHLMRPEIELQFRYFQALEGEIEVPPDFEPRLVQVSARITKPQKLTLEESFPWQLQERFSHVGK